VYTDTPLITLITASGSACEAGCDAAARTTATVTVVRQGGDAAVAAGAGAFRGVAGATTFGAVACGAGRACSGGDTACRTGAAGENGAVKGAAAAIAAGNIARSAAANVGVLLVCLICRLKTFGESSRNDRASGRASGRASERESERMEEREAA
jgi:hypothetical protein